MKIKVVLVNDYSGDWQGLYVDGKLVDENHSLCVSDVCTKLSEVGPFEFENVEVNERWLSDRGTLPEDFSEVVLDI